MITLRPLADVAQRPQGKDIATCPFPPHPLAPLKSLVRLSQSVDRWPPVAHLGRGHAFHQGTEGTGVGLGHLGRKSSYALEETANGGTFADASSRAERGLVTESPGDAAGLTGPEREERVACLKHGPACRFGQREIAGDREAGVDAHEVRWTDVRLSSTTKADATNREHAAGPY